MLVYSTERIFVQVDKMHAQPHFFLLLCKFLQYVQSRSKALCLLQLKYIFRYCSPQEHCSVCRLHVLSYLPLVTVPKPI